MYLMYLNLARRNVYLRVLRKGEFERERKREREFERDSLKKRKRWFEREKERA
jgi:hypothetical protein